MERAYWIILSYVAVKAELQEKILRYVISFCLFGVFVVATVVSPVLSTWGKLY